MVIVGFANCHGIDAAGGSPLTICAAVTRRGSMQGVGRPDCHLLLKGINEKVWRYPPALIPTIGMQLL
jgi:hypothetical protein